MQLDRNEHNLILIEALDFFSASLASVFVTVFLFLHSDLKTTIFYSIISFSALLFAYIISGWTLRRIASGTIIRLALLGSAAFYFLLFVLQEQAITYLVPIALFNGFVRGNYWAAFNLNQYIYTSKDKRVKYFGSAIALINALQAIGPLIGGAIVTFSGSLVFFGLPFGYSLLFLLVSIILACSALLIGRLPKHEMISFRFSDIITHKRSRSWKYILASNAALGFFDTALGTITGVLIYLIVKQEVLLGVTQTGAFVLGALGSMVSIPLLHRQARFYWVGSIGLSLGIGLFAFYQNVYGLIAYTIVTGVSAPFLHTWLSTIYFHAMDTVDRNWKEKYHLLIEREFALGAARILSYIGIYLVIYYGDQVVLAKQWLIFLPLFPLILGVLLHFYEKSTITH